MARPDYKQSIVNLVSSLVQAVGGDPGDYAPLPTLQGRLGNKGPLVLLIIDGLGDLFLQKRRASFLARHRLGSLTSVFPPTTAAAITSFFTGVAPQQHAITGWHTYFRELGTVATVLPFVPRCGGSSFVEMGVSPTQLIDHGSVLQEKEACHILMPADLADSAYSRALAGRARRHAFTSLPEMFARLESLVARQSAALVICYWSELDSLAHSHGTSSLEVADHFQALDAACAASLPRLAAGGATVAVTADHGLINTGADSLIRLEDHPELAAMLTLPLCGEPRCAYCYVHVDRGSDFEEYVAARLGHASVLYRSQTLVEQGYLGRGRPSPHLLERLGDYILPEFNS